MSDHAAWIGRTEEAHDCLTQAMVARLAATLDRDDGSWPKGAAPPLAHWLCFLPAAAQSAIDGDGHPRRGDFLPPIDLPRRMWAGGRLTFHGPVPLDVPLVRRSTIADIREKAGASGRLVFVTVRHEVLAGAETLITEEQDLVYREAARPAGGAVPPTPPPELPPSDVEQMVTPDAVLLFRYSALTFNAHRIHYDRDYARDVEGYAGLVVQGPLLATLLADYWTRASGNARIARFSFRAQRPLLDDRPFALCLRHSPDGATLWTRDADGHATMTAEVQAA